MRVRTHARTRRTICLFREYSDWFRCDQKCQNNSNQLDRDKHLAEIDYKLRMYLYGECDFKTGNWDEKKNTILALDGSIDRSIERV